MNKLIAVRHASNCRKCGERIPAGAQAYWRKGYGVTHFPDCEKAEAKPEAPKQTERVFQIDWKRIRDTYLDLTDEKRPAQDFCKRSNNVKLLESHVKGWKKGGTFFGVTSNQMKTWIVSGFHVPGIENAKPDLTPIRQRRRMKFEDDGELQVDLALSGFDYPFIEWEKRERKPGMRLEIGTCFNASTKNEVIASYERWIAQAISTLEEFGYDLEVNISGSVRNSWRGNPGIEKTLIRVKRENEASDFAEWSALLSPGGFRHLMFLAMILAADDSGQDLDSSLGSAFGRDWKIGLESETRTMEIDNPNSPWEFPDAIMTEKFISVIAPK